MERALELLRTNHERIDYDLRVFLARQRTAYERRQKHGTSNEVDSKEPPVTDGWDSVRIVKDRINNLNSFCLLDLVAVNY